MDTLPRPTLTSLVAFILSGVPVLANADQPAGIVVTYGDLDLTSSHGVRTMYARLEAAARTACAAHERPGSNERITACIDYNVGLAVARVGAPRLSVLYETRTGHVMSR